MDISSAIFDSELGCSAFTVERIKYTRSRDGTTSRGTTAQGLGCIHPGTPEMMQLLPEEEKTDQFIAIYTDFPLSTGTPEGEAGASFVAADRVHWGGKAWRIVRVRDWSSFGYYQAYAVEINE